jgi:hypothetical protein
MLQKDFYKSQSFINSYKIGKHHSGNARLLPGVSSGRFLIQIKSSPAGLSCRIFFLLKFTSKKSAVFPGKTGLETGSPDRPDHKSCTGQI